MKKIAICIRIDSDIDNKINYLINDKKMNSQNIMMIQM